MSDKLMFFLLIVMLVSGVYTYDQYKIGKGEPSPIGQFLDYAGLSKYVDVYKKQKTVEASKEYFHFDSKGKLETLLAAQRRLRDKRNGLLAKRKEIIQKIYNLNNNTQKEASAYISLLDKEKNRILESLPQIKAYGKALATAYQRKNTLSEEQYLKALNDTVMNVFKDVTNNPEENIPYVLNTLKGIDSLIHDEADSIKNYCGDVYSENLEQDVVVSRCIKKRVMDLQGDINLYAKVVKDPLEGFNKVGELTGILDYETRLLMNNSDATENRMQAGAQEVEEGLRYLVQELVEITDKEMQNFLKIYSAYQKEQEALLNNLASNHRRFISSQKMNHPRIERILEDLNATSRFDFSSILNSYKEAEKQRVLLMQEFTANERDLFIATNQRRKDNKVYINSLIKMFESHKNVSPDTVGSLPSSSRYTLAENTSGFLDDGGANPASELMEKRKKERDAQAYRSGQTAQDMERLRREARNNGFYN